ncbi:MAG TPA: hypothetical protein VLE50_06465 [Cellvibrio sp.]|nr:hypothetical protein [Cellvibrio sp.]
MKNKLIFPVLAMVFGFLSSSLTAEEVVATQSSTAAGYFWMTTTSQPGVNVQTLYYSSSQQVAVRVSTGSGCSIYLTDTTNYTINSGATCANYTITRL